MKSINKLDLKLDLELEKDILYKKLYEIAFEIRENAYAKYSNFKVGSALLSKSGKVYIGVNVENSSYGATICAERSAISQGVTCGEQEFIAIAIAGSHGKTLPCGICRQVIFEFSRDIDIIVSDEEGDIEILQIDELLKRGFKL